MSVLSRAEVERTTAEVLGWINACNDVVGAIPDSDAFAEFEMAFESDPITIENAFWAGRRLRSFPCSAQIENQSYDDEQSQGWSLTEQAIECLHMIGQDKYIDPQVLDEAICSLYWCFESVWSCRAHRYFGAFSPEFRAMVRQTTQKRAGERYLVHDAISRDCRPFITAHEVAEWWVWQIGVYLHYCWSGPTHHDWFGFPVNDFISLASENAEHMRTKLATTVNVPLLRQLVTDEGFKLAAIADNRVIPSRPGSTENEWLTDPVPEIDVSRVLRLFEDPDSHDAPRILGLSIRTHHNTDSLRAHQAAHQTPDSGAPMPKNGSRKKKSGHSMSSAEPY